MTVRKIWQYSRALRAGLVSTVGLVLIMGTLPNIVVYLPDVALAQDHTIFIRLGSPRLTQPFPARMRSL